MEFNLNDEQNWLINLIVKTKDNKITPVESNKILLKHFEESYYIPMKKDDSEYYHSVNINFPKVNPYHWGQLLINIIFINNKILHFISELPGGNSVESKKVIDDYFDYVITRLKLDDPQIYLSEFSQNGFYPNLAALYRKLVKQE